MSQWTNERLSTHVQRFIKANPGKPCRVLDQRNFHGTFVSELNLRDFPFDMQRLRITVMTSPTSVVTFSHKMGRDEATGLAKPMLVDNSVMSTIKANAEDELLSEWDLLLIDPSTKGGGRGREGGSSPAVLKYRFLEHDKKYSAEGAIYQRLDAYMFVKRETKNMAVTVMLPTTMLSCMSLSVFALDVESSQGDRFSILFTLILTIIANQLVTSARLPNLAYFTWLDFVMLSLQFIVYGIVVETAMVVPFSRLSGVDPQLADRYALFVFIALLLAQIVISWTVAFFMIRRRNEQMRKSRDDGASSFEVEETRIAEIRRKFGLPAKVFTIPGRQAVDDSEANIRLRIVPTQ